MNTDFGRFYIRSQIAFAVISSIPWLLLAVASVVFLPLYPLQSLFVLLYGAAALYIGIHWFRARDSIVTSITIRIGSICLWLIPTTLSLLAIVGTVLAATDNRPDIFNDVEFQPLHFLPFPILATIWFGVPLVFSILYARQPSLQKAQQDAAANP